MTKDDILKRVNADSYFFQTEWKGFKVYGLDFGDDATIGLPMFILEKENQARLTTEEEAFAILDTFSDDE